MADWEEDYFGAYTAERELQYAEEGEEGEEEEGADYGSEKEEEMKADFADIQRTSRGGTALIEGRLGVIQRRMKTPIQRFAEKFAVEFKYYEEDPVRVEDAKIMIENIPRAEFLSPTYAAAAVAFVFLKQSTGKAYKPLGPSDKKPLTKFIEDSKGLNIIDMIRYIRVVEKFAISK